MRIGIIFLGLLCVSLGLADHHEKSEKASAGKDPKSDENVMSASSEEKAISVGSNEKENSAISEEKATSVGSEDMENSASSEEQATSVGTEDQEQAEEEEAKDETGQWSTESAISVTDEYGQIVYDQSIADELEKEALAWINSHPEGLTLQLEEDEIGFEPITAEINSFKYESDDREWYVVIGFEGAIDSNQSLSDIQNQFRYIALDSVPVPDFDAGDEWEVSASTPVSSFDEGVTITDFDGEFIRLTVETTFYGIFGNRKNIEYIADGPAPPGSYFGGRTDFKGSITIALPIYFDYTSDYDDSDYGSSNETDTLLDPAEIGEVIEDPLPDSVDQADEAVVAGEPLDEGELIEEGPGGFGEGFFNDDPCCSSDPAELAKCTTPFDTTDAEKQKQLALDWISSHPEGLVLNYEDSTGGFFVPDWSDGSHLELEQGRYGVSLKFKAPIKAEDKVENLEVDYAALQKLPIPDLATEDSWDVIPDTPVSSFEDGIKVLSFDGKMIEVSIETTMFQIYGSLKQAAPLAADSCSPPGTYFAAKADFPAKITLKVPVALEQKPQNREEVKDA